MFRKDLMLGLSVADIGSGEFHFSSLSCGTVFETLAMGKPILHRRDDELYSSFYSDLYPMIHVISDDGVTAALRAYAAGPERFRYMGTAGRQWLEKHGVEEPLSVFSKLIREVFLERKSGRGGTSERGKAIRAVLGSARDLINNGSIARRLARKMFPGMQ